MKKVVGLLAVGLLVLVVVVSMVSAQSRSLRGEAAEGGLGGPGYVDPDGPRSSSGGYSSSYTPPPSRGDAACTVHCGKYSFIQPELHYMCMSNCRKYGHTGGL
jgi:hypothetical protein